MNHRRALVAIGATAVIGSILMVGVHGRGGCLAAGAWPATAMPALATTATAIAATAGPRTARPTSAGSAPAVVGAASTLAGTVALYLPVGLRTWDMRAAPTPTPTPVTSGLIDIVGQVGGTAWDVAVQGDYAYLAAGAAVTIVDISDVAHLRPIARTAAFPGIVQGVDVSGTRLYLAVSAGVALGYHEVDPLGQSRGLAVVDVADSAHPRTAAVVPLPGGANDVVVSGDYAYVASGAWAGSDMVEPALRVFDIRSPASPREIGRLHRDEVPWRLALDGDFAYVGYQNCARIDVVRISDKARPTWVGGIASEFGDTTSGIAVGDGLLVYANGPGWVADVRDPTAPKVAGAAICAAGDSWSWELGSAVVDGQALLVGEDAACLVDPAALTPGDPVEVPPYRAPSSPLAGLGTSIVIDGDRALVATNRGAPWGEYWPDEQSTRWQLGGGLAVLALADRALAVVSTTEGPAVDTYGIAADQDRLYTVEGGGWYEPTPRLWVLEADDPSAPVAVGHADVITVPLGVAVGDGRAFVLTADGIEVFDVADATAPRRVGRAALDLAPCSWGNRPAVYRSGYVYATCRYGNPDCLQIIDVREPEAPRLVPGCLLTASDLALARDGTLAVARGWSERPALTLLDLSEPEAPRPIAEVPPPAPWPQLWYDAVAIDGDLAYAAFTDSNEWGAVVIDIGQPAEPRMTGYLRYILESFVEPPRPTTAVAIAAEAGRVVFVNQDGYAGEFDLSEPAHPISSPGAWIPPFQDAGHGGGWAPSGPVDALAWRGYVYTTAAPGGLTVIRPGK